MDDMKDDRVRGGGNPCENDEGSSSECLGPEGPVKEYVIEDGILKEDGGLDFGPEAESVPPAEDDEASAAQKRIAELEGDLAAARADLYNYRQRVARERQQARRLIVDDTIENLLPVLDNLDRALAVPEEGSAKDVLVGVRMVRRQFLSALEEMGVKPIPAEGAAFDPAIHEAVETVAVEDPEQDGMVQAELLCGYRSGERVLRASRVTVGKA